MAFDQISLFLYPPRWERQSVADERMTHYSGEPVRIVSAGRRADGEGAVARFTDLCRWFESRGFEVVVRSPEYANFYSAAVQATLGRRAEIDVSADAEGGEVTSLYCRFLLTRDTPLHVQRWEAFMLQLCGAFGLRISVSDSASVGAEEFLGVVQRTDNWRCFTEQFGWASSSEGGPGR